MKRHDWKNLILAGVIAGIVSTIIQGLAWLLSGTPVIETFLRDSKLAAALVLGTGIIGAAVEGAGQWVLILSAATVVHFALSIGFAFAIVPPTRRLALRPAVLVGGLLGLVLYVINLHLMTEVFPWFVVSRGVATVLAHVAFGVSAVWAYRALARHGSS